MEVKFISVMGTLNRFLNAAVASVLAIGLLCAPVRAADPARLEGLYARLRAAGPDDAPRLAREIAMEWSKSGSPAMDLLLQRGNDALEAGDAQAASEHFTALTDHAPDFADAWYRRALAFMMAGLDGPAMADLRRALRLEPRHYDALAGLGAIAARSGRPDLARRAFAAALAIYPHHPRAAQALRRLDIESGGKDI